MHVYGGLPQGETNGREGGKEMTLRCERMEVHYIYTYEDSIMKPTKHCLKRKGIRERGMGI
jgi:hypothetical protein